jgi:hypothetical protein
MIRIAPGRIREADAPDQAGPSISSKTLRRLQNLQ